MSRQDDIYKQCKLTRDLGNGASLIQVAYIPNCYAVVGKQLKVLRAGEWVDGWVVRAVWTTKKFSDIEVQREAQKRWEGVLSDH